MGMGDQRHAPAALPPVKSSGAHFIGKCMDRQDWFGWVGKTRLHQNLIPGPSSLQRVVIPTEQCTLCYTLQDLIVYSFHIRSFWFRNIDTGDSVVQCIVFPVITVLTRPRLGSDFVLNSRVANTRCVEPCIDWFSKFFLNLIFLIFRYVS